MKSDTTSENLLRQYYGSHKGPASVPPSPEPRPKLQQTPSVSHVLSEVRKLLAQRSGNNSRLSEKELTTLVEKVEEQEAEDLSSDERALAVLALKTSLENFDILTPLTENESINDIIVRSWDDISVQSGRSNIQTDLKFADPKSYESFIENLLKRVGKSCTTSTPVVDAAINENVRACVTHESFSPPGSGPMLTLRVSRHKDISLEGLVALEVAPREVLAYLKQLVSKSRGTLLIAGETGTGKTTLVKALAGQIPENEAVLVIEDTHELTLDRKFTRTLLTREANTEGAGKIAPAKAIRTGMRMAMNRIILGEMRDAEAAEAFVDVCASGHAGMSTIHARSARDAISRLELFLLRAQPQASVEAIRRQIANSVSAVAYLSLDPQQGKRRLSEIVEVSNASEGAVQFSPIFSLTKKAESLVWTRESGISKYVDSFGQVEVSDYDGLPRPGAEFSFDPESLYLSHTQGGS